MFQRAVRHSAEAASQPVSLRRRRYAFVSARRQLVFGPGFLWTLLGLFALTSVWSVASAGFFLFKDQIVTRLAAHQVAVQEAYEDRIASLRAQIDRLSGQQLTDVGSLERQVEQLASRQARLEAQASSLSNVPVSKPADPAPGREESAADRARPADATAPGRQSSLTARDARSDRWHGSDRVKAVRAALGRIEARQNAALASMAAKYDASARRMGGVLTDLGIDLRKSLRDDAPSAVGGPFTPAPIASGTDSFGHQLARVHAARLQLDRLNRALTGVPVRKPLAGELDVASGYGARPDPFLRIAAMHSGLDLRAAPGEAVRATAGGTVTVAGWSGGYGRMVEIDHGHGLTTRYAHLSDIRVSEEEVVRPGQIIGRVGSTGRSTGPHLHYETRIGGEAVDPHRFLRAGMRLDGGL